MLQSHNSSFAKVANQSMTPNEITVLSGNDISNSIQTKDNKESDMVVYEKNNNSPEQFMKVTFMNKPSLNENSSNI